MGERRRNHIIPRFFLNRFASRAAGDTAWIWQYSRDRTPIEISTRDAAVGKDFYGGSESDVEAGLARLESRFAEVLANLDREASPERFAEDLRLFVWNIASRTRALRLAALEAMQRVTEQLRTSISNPAGRQALSALLARDYDRLMKEAAEGLPPEGKMLWERMSATSGTRDLLIDWMTDQLESGEMQSLFNAFFSTLIKSIPPAAAAGHVKGLADLISEEAAPEKFMPAAWSVEEHDGLILGDAGVVALNRSREAGSLIRFADDWLICFLPLGAKRLLVANNGPVGSPLSTGEANRASASLSYAFFWADAKKNKYLELTRLIADADAIVTLEDSREIIEGELARVRDGQPSEKTRKPTRG